MSEPNPACACGCGREVSRPSHNYVVGHQRPRKMIDSEVAEAKDLLDYGFSTYAIAKWYGVSPSYIWCIGNGARKTRNHVSWNTAETVRSDVIAAQQAIHGLRKVLRTIRKEADVRR